MNTKLITALRTAAKAVENGTFNYNWNHPEQCNCGVVACTLLGKSATQLTKMLPQMEKPHTWQRYVGNYCPVTGIPEMEIFKSLMAAGLTQQDLVELEQLSNPEVHKRAGWAATRTVTKSRWFGLIKEQVTEMVTPSHSSKNNLISYLRAWADILQERGAADAVTTQPTHETASVLE